MAAFTRVIRAVAAVAVCAGLIAALVAPEFAHGDSGGSETAVAAGTSVAEGRSLYATGCQSCHGIQADGISGVAPSLRGVGAQAADFYLSTGRMPLSNPSDEPTRRPPAYSPRQIAALVAYIGSLGGPAVPRLGLAQADLSAGMHAFMLDCSGCHQALGRGGVVTGASVPSLASATPTQIAEAVRIGPYLMPRFGTRSIDRRTLADIAAYVESTKAPDDRGGWGIGHIGPIPEGMVAWMAGLLSLVVITRVIGERMKQ